MADTTERYRRALDHYTRLVHQIGHDQWGLATPCADWDVRALVNHLTSENRWVDPLLAGRTIAEVGSSLDGDLLGPDPVAAWDEAASAAAGSVERTRLQAVVHISRGDVPAAEYLDEVFLDLVIHGWDLARAIGADETIDPEFAELIYARCAPLEDLLKATGVFGPKGSPPEGADLQTKLLAVFGRVA
jgi:uncharacterized protein (TIGR03086 family)